jgi:hypothetical protein
MMALEVNTKPVLQAGNPRALFLSEMVDTGIRSGPTSWDIAPDGRFLIITRKLDRRVDDHCSKLAGRFKEVVFPVPIVTRTYRDNEFGQCYVITN